MRKIGKRIGAVVLLGLVVASIGAATASAETIVREGDFNVLESNYDVDTGFDVAYGNRVEISASCSIWAGWWFIGPNGPAGLWFNGNSWDYPAPSQPAASLLGKLNGQYFYVGNGVSRMHYNYTSRLRLRINDNVPGNGNGAFCVHVRIVRP